MTIDISIIINQMQMFASLILVGLVIQKTKILSDENITNFSALLTKFIIPCMLLTMMPNGGSLADVSSCGAFVLTAIIYISSMIIIGLIVARLIGIKDVAHRRMHGIICSFGNAGFIGAPLVAAVYPQLGIANAMYVLIEAIFCWGTGPVIADPNTKFNKENLKNLITPLTMSIFAGFILTILDIHPAGFIPWDAITAIGSTTKYFASFYIGLNLGRTGFRKIFADPRVFVSSLLKLFIFPLTLYIIIRRLGIFSNDMLGLILIMAATPTGMAVPMVAEVAHGDQSYAIAGTMTNTILCLITIPLVARLAMML